MMGRLAGMLVLLVGTGCAALPGAVPDYGVGYQSKGIASWYGEAFHGNPTASGEIYDMYGMSAAHRIMPLGSMIRVTHLENGRTVQVKVNDRGPFVRGRVLDLSYGAALALDMVRQGTAPVRFQVVGVPPGFGRPYTVQVGAFTVEGNARELSKRLSRDYPEVSVKIFRSKFGSLYRVRVGSFDDERRAQKTARKIARREGLETYVIRLE
jgi:rare lipoprotein A